MRSLKENALYKYSRLCEAKDGDAERLVNKVTFHLKNLT
jgi:hypothetical protein